MKSMNIIEFSEGLQAKMRLELDKLDANQDEIVKIGKTLTFIRELISELKAFTRNYKFQNQAEEIQFFKEVKPIFLSQYFYYKKVFAIRLFDSFKDKKNRQINYYQLLRHQETYAKKNREFYEYCMSGSTYLDTYYFTRNNTSQKSIDQDENFTTCYDTKVAKILANELIKIYILNLLQGTTMDQASNTPLTWTGQKTDLTELIYALHSIEVFNNGSANIKLIASTFEHSFNVKLGDYYRTFQEIRLRKRRQTPFLDHLREKALQRINEST